MNCALPLTQRPRLTFLGRPKLQFSSSHVEFDVWPGPNLHFILNVLTSKVSGDKLAEGSFTFPAVSLAVSFLTVLRSGT